MTPTILTMEEAGERMKIPPRAVIRLCRLGQLPGARKAGRSWRVPEAAIAAFFAVPAPKEGDEPLDEEPAGDRVEAVEAPAEAVRAPDVRARAPGKAAARGQQARLKIPSPRTDRAGFLRLLSAGVRPQRPSERGRH